MRTVRLEGLNDFAEWRGIARSLLLSGTSPDETSWNDGTKNPEFFDSFDEVAPFISQHGDDTWISLGGGDRLILKDVDAGDLNEDNVVFNIPM